METSLRDSQQRAAALLTALAFAWLINRPMRQITASIRALGRAELDQPVRVSGPRDLQAIEAIYRVLSWIYENAARIFTLIEAVVNGIVAVINAVVDAVVTVLQSIINIF